MTEEQPTMAPSDIDHDSREGYGANKVAAEHVLLDSGMAVSVLRPSRIHGAGGTRPREWVFVRRVLDGRRHLLLARGGRGTNHPTAAVNLAALIEFCAARPATRILNSADPDAPDGLTISRVVAAHLGHRWDEVLLDATAPGDLGDHPWNTLPPFVLDTSAAERLGFVPAGSYAETVRAEVDWLAEAARPGGPAAALPPPDDPYFRSFFDYAREDAWLDGHSPSEESGGTGRFSRSRSVSRYSLAAPFKWSKKQVAAGSGGQDDHADARPGPAGSRTERG